MKFNFSFVGISLDLLILILKILLAVGGVIAIAIFLIKQSRKNK